MGLAAWTALPDWRILRSQVLGESRLPAISISPWTANDRGINSSSAHANVLEPHGAEPGRIQQILCVYDDRLLQ